MKKLILHIGSHKTGSTSIQHALAKYRDELKKLGYDVFSYDRNQKLNLNKGQAHALVNPRKGNLHWPIVQLLAESENNTIVSTENLSWIFDINVIQEFYDRISSNFDSIEVIIYIRRQDKHVVSHVQESSKSIGKASSSFYSRPLDSIPEYEDKFDLYFDYYSRISKWAKVFKKECINIRVFEKSKMLNGDAVIDFFKTANIPFNSVTLSTNISLGFSKTKLGLILNKYGIEHKFRSLIFSNMDDSDKRLPSRQNAKYFYERYAKSNEQLKCEYDIEGVGENETLFSENFDAYPEIGTDIWEQNETNEIIGNSIKNLTEYIKSYQGRSVLILGDSNTTIFEDKQWREIAPVIKWDVVGIKGASLSGLSNPNSEINSMHIFNWAITHKKYDAAVFNLGEVDFGYLIHYHVEKNNIDKQNTVLKAIENYKHIILKAQKHAPVIVFSTCVPVVSDYMDNKMENQRKIKTSQDERTQLTLKFNKRMQEWCIQNDIIFLNLDGLVLSNNGLIKTRFVPINKNSHHYNKKAYLQLLKHQLLPKVLSVTAS